MSIATGSAPGNEAITTRLDAALAIAAFGWPVFQLHHALDAGRCSCLSTKKTACTAPGKHPVRTGWQGEATRDESEIRRLWAKRPLANIGIPTGSRTSLWVVGPDGPAGIEALACLEQQHGSIPATPTQETGSAGRHHFFLLPAGLRISNARNHRGVPIDIRGEGGLVVGPGSRNANGDYRWLPGLSPADVPLAEAPDWLLEWAGAEPLLAEEPAPDSDPHRNGTAAPSVIDRARAYLTQCPPVVAHQGGHALTFRVSRVIVWEFGLGVEEGLRLLLSDYNPRCEPPWTEKELRHKVEDADSKPYRKERGCKLQENRPLSYSSRASATALPPSPGETSEAGDDNARIHLTDVGNAQRVVKDHGQDMRFCHPWKSWLCWDGRRWAVDEVAEICRRVKQTQAALYCWTADTLKQLAAEQITEGDEEAEAKRNGEKKKLTALLHHCLKWEDDRRITATLNQMKSEPGIPMLPAQLDADPWLLNVEIGTLDLRTGKLQPHRRENLITRLCPVKYDPAAKCPRWDSFVLWAMKGRPSLVEYLRRVVGYCLTADVSEQVLWFLHGNGANGKSTFILTLLRLLGDYAMQAVSELLLARSQETHPTERADLFGRRLVATIETDEGKRLAEALLKQLTGGDRMRARKMRQDFFEMDATWKLFLVANHKPNVRGQDLAVWRRIKLVPFEVTVDPDEKDQHLGNKLKAELPGILNWAVEGCLAWQKDGLQEPAEVSAATRDYQSEQDLLAKFLQECCVLSPHARFQSGALHKAYVEWSGDHEMTPKQLRKKLDDKRYSCTKSTGGRMYWHGIGPATDGDVGEAWTDH
jgi:putative DNA primase/helicase